MKIALIYTDDGPKGAGGQDCRTTNPWVKVFVFDSSKELGEFCKTKEYEDLKNTKRKNSRIRFADEGEDLKFIN